MVSFPERAEAPVSHHADAAGKLDVASVELLKNHGVLVNMTGNTRFAPGSAVVNPAFLGSLQKVASVARTYGKVTITAIGHPDKGGTYTERERLSSQRAEAIRLQLIGMGVPSILVSASGNPRSSWEDGRTELVIPRDRHSG